MAALDSGSVPASSTRTRSRSAPNLQANYFAGAWAKHAQDDKVFDVSAGDLDSALAGILSLKDSPGTTSETDRRRTRQRVRPCQRLPGWL